jgi:hypothetical protein
LGKRWREKVNPPGNVVSDLPAGTLSSSNNGQRVFSLNVGSRFMQATLLPGIARLQSEPNRLN